jgi:hypothetical protein
MPIRRDVRVRKVGVDASAPVPNTVSDKGADIHETAPDLSNLVTVMGFDNKDVLFRSNSVGAIQWRNSNGEVVAMLVKMKPDVWGFSCSGDDDWPQMFEMYGRPEIS